VSWWISASPEGFTQLAESQVSTDLDGLMRRKDRSQGEVLFSGICQKCGDDVVGLRGLNCAKCRRRNGEGRAEGHNRRGIAKGRVTFRG
jgi:hypothetical protein